MQRSVALALVACLVVGYPTGSLAYKSKAHVYVANEALAELDSPGTSAWIRGLGLVPLKNDEIMAAVRAFPDHFRAGALGPDSFPDLIAGQLWVHVNGGCPEGPCGLADATGVASGVLLDQRTMGQWRSIDYGMYQLRKALLEPAGTARQQAIAFAYGYLAHEMSDGFAHGWVNEWTRSYFSYFKGSGLYGTLTEEIQHVALESYLDKHLKPSRAADLTLAAPYDFLNGVYLRPVADAAINGGTQIGRAGDFAGVYYRELVRIRDLMNDLSHRGNWYRLANSRDPVGAVAVKALLDVQYLLDNIKSLGTDIFNPIADIEHYFAVRRDVFDALLTGWVKLSGCTSQNMIRGGNVPPDQIVADDACRALDFETTPDLEEIFDGKLNEAAQYGSGQADFNYGSLGNNLKKMTYFLRVIENVALRLSITEDVESIRKLMSMFDWCDHALVRWGSCENACNTATRTCTKIVEIAACYSCPTRKGHYSCNPWYSGRRLACYAMPWCFACQSHWLDEVIDAGCASTVDAATGVCALCTKNAICKTVELSRSAILAVPEAIDKALQPLVDAVKDEVKRRIIEAYAGPYVEDFIAAFHELERSWRAGTPAWIVNVAFLREDLRADPRHLNRIIAAAIGVSESAVDNGAETALAIQHTVANTVGAARSVIQAYVMLQSGMAEEILWENLVTVLYRIAREQSFDAVLDMRGDAYAWLDGVSFKTDQSTYDTRFAKFIALCARLKLLSNIRGPTVLAFRAELGLDTEAGDVPGGFIEAHAVHVLHNSIELVKLGFLGEQGISGLLARAGGTQVDLLVQSGICSIVPYIGCDSVQSLDDPSNVKYEPTSAAQVAAERPRPDPELSVARWYTNTYKWVDGSALAAQSDRCVTTLTDFALAQTEARVSTLYDAVFRYPPRCPQQACAFQTCSAQGFNCGLASDGCSGYQNCGTCDAGSVCSKNLCCTPTTCAAQGRTCGVMPDGCGGVLACGPACPYEAWLPVIIEYLTQ